MDSETKSSKRPRRRWVKLAAFAAVGVLALAACDTGYYAINGDQIPATSAGGEGADGLGVNVTANYDEHGIVNMNVIGALHFRTPVDTGASQVVGVFDRTGDGPGYTGTLTVTLADGTKCTGGISNASTNGKTLNATVAGVCGGTKGFGGVFRFTDVS